MATTDWPRRIDICPWGNWYSNTSYSTRTQYSGYFSGGTIVNGGVQNAEVVWKVPLSAGTWTLTLFYEKGSNIGNNHMYLDSTALGSFDGYNASPIFTSVGEITGIVVASSGVYSLKAKVESKNASSSNYHSRVIWVNLRRTA